MTRKKSTSLLPPCSGESHASFVSTNVAIIPNAELLKICLPLILKIYFPATDRNAANKLIYQKLVLSNKQRLMALIRTLKPHFENSWIARKRFERNESIVYWKKRQPLILIT